MKLLYIIIPLLAAISISEAAEANLRVYNGWKVGKPLPYIVSIQGVDRMHICGGTIISFQWILTAAHCVANQTNLRILAGTDDTSKLDRKSQLVEVDRVEVHYIFDNDDSENIEYDIALLYLRTPLSFNENVSFINLATKDDMEEAFRKNDTNSFIAGWGGTEDAYLSKKLKWAMVTLLGSQECLEDIPETCHLFNPESHICTGPLDEIKTGAGMKDDGGPLVVNGVLAGVINHGEHDLWTDPNPCHKSTIYTKISYYSDWIIGVTQPASESPEEVVVYRIEITLTPTEGELESPDAVQKYSLGYRVWWLPDSEESSAQEENYTSHNLLPHDETSLEPNGQYEIEYGRVITINIQFFFTKVGDTYSRFQDMPVEFRSSIITRKA